GGGGKTRLAIKIGEHFGRGSALGPHIPSFPDGLYFVDLSPLTEESRVVDTVAQTLGVRQDADKDLTDSLLTHLENKRILLVLDNCEHLINACATLADQLLNVESDLNVIATSREALGVSGEKVYLLRPLAVPVAETNARGVESSDAVKLFVDRAQLAQSDFYISELNAFDVAEICRRLDGIPLAIELAAARVKVLSVSQIRQKLNDRFRLLTGEGRTALPRHQTLQAAIRWSYEQLSPDEQRLLRLLSVFAGGCTLELIVALCRGGPRLPNNDDRADTSDTSNLPLDDFQLLDLLTRLIDKSLVAATSDRDGQRRYTMLETVRAFAYERLVEAQEAPTARKLHLEAFLDIAEGAYADRINREQKLLGTLESEIDNLRTALEFARSDDAEKYLELVGALAWFWQLHSHLREGREHLTAALPIGAHAKMSAGAGAERRASEPTKEAVIETHRPEAARAHAPVPARRSAARARALCGAAHLLRWQGDPVTAQSWMHEALAIWRELGDEREIAFAL
ncbi:MAG: ATP-binding protein, partial [Pyrinomonadaceae bacterium]